MNIRDRIIDLRRVKATGSTLIAAEQLGRKCYGMELHEPYCDVILTRWMNLTNQEPTLEETGETFSKVKSKRTRKAVPA